MNADTTEPRKAQEIFKVNHGHRQRFRRHAGVDRPKIKLMFLEKELVDLKDSQLEKKKKKKIHMETESHRKREGLYE